MKSVMKLIIVWILLAPMLAASVDQLAVIASRTRPKCYIELSRALGELNFFSLVCKCGSFYEGKSLVLVPAPAPKLDTVGRTQAIINCIEHRERELVHACECSASRFSSIAEPILKHCVKTKLTNEEEKQNSPFSFDQKTCKSKFGLGLVGSTTVSIAWLCECKQDRLFEVIPSWPAYNLTGDASTIRQDAKFIRKCAIQEASKTLSRLCRESYNDYYIQGLQIIETCCKRLRVSSDRKFECQAIVP